MIKKAICLLAVMGVFTMFSGCGKSNISSNIQPDNTSFQTSSTLDIKAMANDALANLPFAETPEEVDGAYAVEQYELDGSCCSALCFNTSSAVADTLVIFKVNEEQYAQTVKSAVDDRILYLKDGYADYGPEQVPKIESAVILVKGVYVVICICENNESAKDFFQNYMTEV